MNKSELVVKLKDKVDLNTNQIKEGVNVFFDQITSALLQNKRVDIRGFGTFCLHKHNAHMGYNPNTGRKYYISEKQIPYFRASSKLKAAMNENLLK